MAAPKWHVLTTAPIAVVSAVAYPATTPENIIILAGIIGLGIFVDGDHLSIRRVKKILRGEKGPVPGWTNWAHTWWFAAMLVVGSFFLGNWLPFISYAVHMLIDGGNKTMLEPNIKWGNSPLPEFLHQFYPRWLTYETGLII